MTRTLAFISSGLLLLSSGAFAFGIDPGENNLGSEHEKITRAAIHELGPLTLRQLAGGGGYAGAVGAPDDPDRELIGQASAHCDAGDFLDREGGYGQPLEQAQAALTSCRNFIISNIDRAVALSGSLLKADPGAVRLECDFNSDRGPTKCRVLAHLGLAFHAAQDFYANSNWVDRPANGPVSGTNPPGLGQSGRARWLDPRLQENFPDGLLSGCPGDLHLMGVTIGCEYGALPPIVGGTRVLRKDLAKSNGPIGRGAGGTGTTPRGAINGNFSRAVSAAVEDTADKWAFFRARVLETYGRTRGENILCTLGQDDFDPKSCEARAVSVRVCSERELGADWTPDDDVFAPGLTPTEDERAGAQGLLENLRRYCVIEETDVTRAFVINGSSSPEGRLAAEKEAVEGLAYWGACPVELARKLPSLTQSNKDEYKAQLSMPKPDLKKEMSLLTRMYASCVLDAHLRQSTKK